VQAHRCSICYDPKRLNFVDNLLAQGKTVHAISEASRTYEAEERGVKPMKQDTIRRHLKVCPTVPDELRRGNVRIAENGQSFHVTPYIPRAETVVTVPAKSPPPAGDSGDIAVLVRDAVKEKIEKEEVRLTVQHGLQAQAMIDRRIEKQKDRELAVRLAVVMTDARPPERVLKTVFPEPVVIDQ
jgi:hypothetical protein